MASREETLLFVVDVQVKGRERLAALRGEMDAALAPHEAQLLRLRDAAQTAAQGHQSLAESFDQVRARGLDLGGAGIPTPPSQPAGPDIVGIRGRRDVGSRQNPLVDVAESGQAAGLGSLAADSPLRPATERRAVAPSLVPTAADIATQDALAKVDRDAARIADAVELQQQQSATLGGGSSAQRILRDLDAARQSGAPQIWDQTALDALAPRRPPSTRLLSSGEAAGRLGVSRSAANELAATGQIPGAYKQGGQWVIPEQAVIDLVEGGGGAGGGRRPPTVTGGGSGGGSGGGFGFGGGSGGGGRRTLRTPLGGLRTIDDSDKSPFSFANLFKGDQGRGGAFGLPGFGSIGSLAGLGLEHWILTSMGLLGSAGKAVEGAGVMGTAGLTQMLIGGGSDALVGHAALTNVKAAVPLYQALTSAVKQYGPASQQAQAAQAAWDSEIAKVGPQVAEAAKNYVTLKSTFDSMAKGAEQDSAKVMSQVLGLGQSFLPEVTQAAAKNLTIINTALKPMFAWLEGPEGMQIFQSLENAFARDLPTSIHAFDMGIEDFLRLMQAASQYTGGLSRDLDNLFTRKGQESTAQYDQEIQKLVADMHEWGALLKVLGQDLGGVFSADQGTANSIVESLTQMLDKLHDWETSTTGMADLQNIFTVHKSEILELLKLLPDFVKGYGSIYMTLAPPLVKALTGIAGAFNDVVTAVEKIPGGADILGAAFLMGKLGILTPAVKALAGAFGLLADNETAAGGAAAAFGGKSALAGAGGLAGDAERAGVGATEVGAGGAAAGLFSRGILGRIGGSTVGTAISGGVESAGLTAGIAAEGVGLGGLGTGIAAGAGALAPVAAAALPVVIGALGAYGGYRLLSAIFGASAAPTSPYSTDQLAKALQSPQGLKAYAGVKNTPLVTVGGVKSGSSYQPGTSITIGQLSEKQLTPVLESYVRQMSNKNTVASMGPSALQGSVNEGQALLSKFPQDATALNKFVADAKQDLAKVDEAMNLMSSRWAKYGQAGLSTLQAVFKSNMGAIASTVTLNSDEGKRLMDQNVDEMIAHVSASMDSGKTSVAAGLAAINSVIETGVKTGATTWNQQWTNMFSTLTGLRKSDLINAASYSTDVTSDLSKGAQQAYTNVTGRYAAMAAQIRASFKDGTDGVIVTQSQLNAQLARLQSGLQSSAADASLGWLQGLKSSLAAAGKLTAAEIEAITAAENRALSKLSGPTLKLQEGILSGRVTLPGGVPAHAVGGKITSPSYVVGEEAPAHPEWVIATNPAYRSRNLGLWMQAGKSLGVPGFAQGGSTGSSMLASGANYAGSMLNIAQSVALNVSLSAAELKRIQKDTSGLVNQQTNLTSIVANLTAIENLNPGTSLRALGLNSKTLRSLGLGGAQNLVGTGLTYWQNIASNNTNGALTQMQLAQAQKGIDALNRSIEQEEKPYEKELREYESKLGSLHGSARTTAEATMQSLAAELLSLKAAVESTTAGMKQLSKATSSASSSTSQLMTGTVGFSYQGQYGYLASDTGMNLGVGS